MEKGIITDDSIRLRLGLSALSQPEYRVKPVIRHFPERDDKQVGREILRFLEDILALPFSPLVQRYKRLSLSMRNGNDIKQKSFSEGFIIQRNIITRKTQLVLLELTGKAKAVLRQEGHVVTDTNEGVEHLFWKEKIAEYYKNKGFSVEVEKQINGKPDIAINTENKLVAVEIETGNSDAVANIQKSLKANFSAIITIATNVEAKEKIMKQFREEGFDKDDRIKVVLAQEYDTAGI
jgi:hypothetical protein